MVLFLRVDSFNRNILQASSTNASRDNPLGPDPLVEQGHQPEGRHYKPAVSICMHAIAIAFLFQPRYLHGDIKSERAYLYIPKDTNKIRKER